MNSDDRDVYRSIIDSLVESCLHGQGQIGRRKVSDGVWHRHVDQLVTADTPDWMRASAEQNQREMQAINGLLGRLDAADKETLARMLDQQFVSGVHETLVVLHGAALPPFDDGYEGTPFHDFAGRLDGWEWPTGSPKT